jgi:hypothetical protein
VHLLVELQMTETHCTAVNKLIKEFHSEMSIFRMLSTIKVYKLSVVYFVHHLYNE